MYCSHIIDPETNQKIPLYNERIYQLLNSGYNVKNFKPYINEKYSRNTLFTNDLIGEYISYFNGYRHIKALLLVDK